MKLFFILFFDLTLIAAESINCSNNSHSLRNDVLIKKHFNSKEIDDLEKILYFFDTEITKSSDKQNFCKLYDNYFRNIKNKLLTKNLSISEKKEDSLLKSINKTTFYKIWNNSYAYKNKRKDSVKIIIINIEGEYINYLKELSIEKPFIYHYYNNIKIMGDISAGTINYMSVIYDKLNINDETDRLIIAIHYLTVNNHFKGEQ